VNVAALLSGPDSPLAGVRNGLAMRRDPIAFLSALAQEGSIVYRRIGSRRTYLFNEPDHIQEILVSHARSWIKGPLIQRSKEIFGDGLVTSDGEHHLRQRRLIQPLFQKERLVNYAPAMVDCAEACHKRWSDGQTLDLHEEMIHLTLAIVGRALFGDDFEQDARHIRETVDQITASISTKAEVATLVLERLGLPVPARQRLLQARRTLGDIIDRLKSKRQREAGEREDLLSLLLDARDIQGDGTGMSATQILDECLSLLLPGHGTTASALTLAFYLLSQHPRAEAQLHAELAAVLGGRPPTVEDLPRLVYTEQVLAETIRLYPPAWLQGRSLIAPVRIGGHDFAPGTLLMICPYTLQRDPRFFAQPLEFHPEHFTAEAKAARPRFAYVPFGAGPHQCIGDGFAWMEGCLVLATIAQRFAMRLAPGEALTIEAQLILRPKHGLRMVAQRREGSV
jgi:cytochrome P450